MSTVRDRQDRALGPEHAGEVLTEIARSTPQRVRALWLFTDAESVDNFRMYARAGYRVVEERTDNRRRGGGARESRRRHERVTSVNAKSA